MICVHSETGEREADHYRKRALEILEVHPSYHEYQATALVQGLQMIKGIWDVDFIHVDQWFAVGIRAERPQAPNPDNGTETYSVECDRLEDGLAALFLHVYDKYEWDD